MIALLLAAQLSAAAGPTVVLAPPKFSFFRQTHQPSFCKGNGVMETSGPAPALLLRPEDKAQLRVRPLADLPKPNKEKAVLRAIDGCANPLVVQFNVGP